MITSQHSRRDDSSVVVTHHGALLDAVARLDDGVVLSGSAQEIRELAVGALHGLALGSVCTVAAFVLRQREKGSSTWRLWRVGALVCGQSPAGGSTCVGVTMGTPPMISVL